MNSCHFPRIPIAAVGVLSGLALKPMKEAFNNVVDGELHAGVNPQRDLMRRAAPAHAPVHTEDGDGVILAVDTKDRTEV